MLEDHLKLANPCRRLRSGPARAYIDDFADWLQERGYPVGSRSLQGNRCQGEAHRDFHVIAAIIPRHPHHLADADSLQLHLVLKAPIPPMPRFAPINPVAHTYNPGAQPGDWL